MPRSWFLAIARAEGLSLLVLFGIAMPLKYLAGHPEAVEVVGWIHGLLFLAYVPALWSHSRAEGWSRPRVAAGLVASVVPFGTFAFERSLT